MTDPVSKISYSVMSKKNGKNREITYIATKTDEKKQVIGSIVIVDKDGDGFDCKDSVNPTGDADASLFNEALKKDETTHSYNPGLVDVLKGSGTPEEGTLGKFLTDIKYDAKDLPKDLPARVTDADGNEKIIDPSVRPIGLSAYQGGGFPMMPNFMGAEGIVGAPYSGPGFGNINFEAIQNWIKALLSGLGAMQIGAVLGGPTGMMNYTNYTNTLPGNIEGALNSFGTLTASNNSELSPADKAKLKSKPAESAKPADTSKADKSADSEAKQKELDAKKAEALALGISVDKNDTIESITSKLETRKKEDERIEKINKKMAEEVEKDKKELQAEEKAKAEAARTPEEKAEKVVSESITQLVKTYSETKANCEKSTDENRIANAQAQERAEQNLRFAKNSAEKNKKDLASSYANLAYYENEFKTKHSVTAAEQIDAFKKQIKEQEECTKSGNSIELLYAFNFNNAAGY